MEQNFVTIKMSFLLERDWKQCNQSYIEFLFKIVWLEVAHNYIPELYIYHVIQKLPIIQKTMLIINNKVLLSSNILKVPPATLTHLKMLILFEMLNNSCWLKHVAFFCVKQVQ